MGVDFSRWGLVPPRNYAKISETTERMTMKFLLDVKLNREARNKKIFLIIGLVCKLWVNKVKKRTKSLFPENATFGIHKIVQDYQY